MKVTIEIDDDAIEHIRGDSCEAGVFKPCGLSGHVMQRVYEAVREDAAPETAAERDRLLAVNAAMLEALDASRAYDNHMMEHACEGPCNERSSLWGAQRVRSSAAYKALGLEHGALGKFKPTAVATGGTS